MSLQTSDIDELVALAHRLADAAARATLPHFRDVALIADNKHAAGFDPVTAADHGAEVAIRALLAQERPEDGIFGEEQERTHGTSGLTWVIDPIDGTRAFISGLPVWGTLIALDDGTRGRIGVIDQPYIGERFTGVVGGDVRAAWLETAGGRRDIATRSRALEEATLFTTDPFLFSEAGRQAFATLRDAVQLTRYGTDCYAYALLAMGLVDLVVEAGLAAYDVAAHIPLIEAAGGIVTDWRGGDCRWGGQVLAAGSLEVHARALEILSPAAEPSG